MTQRPPADYEPTPNEGQDDRQPYVKPTVREQDAYEKLALESCQSVPSTLPPPFGNCQPT